MEENYNGQSEVLPSKPLFSGRAYEWFKFLATIMLPAVATLYLTLGDLWDFPKIQEVVGTITAINAVLGLFLKVSSNQYHNNEDKAFDGIINIDDSGPKTQVGWQWLQDPRDLAKSGVFKVVRTK
jgi:hypothetical protein